MNNMHQNLVKEERLKNIVFKILESSGLSKSDAEIVCDCIIESDLCGVNTHGVAILGAHVKKLTNNGYNTNPLFKVIKETNSFSVVDADNSIGFLSAVFAMKKAIKGAESSGIYSVFSRNANTYGAAFYYAMMASRKGLIGITFSNSPPAMAPWGGKDKLLGTNPLAIAVPGNNKEMIVFDMATSKVAKSKINQAKQQGKKIPYDWALDINGVPTDDPEKAIKGLILPMAEYKGYGLALTIDVLSGVLSGAAFLDQVGRFYSEEGKCMNVGQTFIAMDPRVIYGEGFYELISQYIIKIRRSDSISGNIIKVPGDGKHFYKQQNKKYGIPLNSTTINELNKLLLKLDIDERLFD